jgi:hypothetical protein
MGKLAQINPDPPAGAKMPPSEAQFLIKIPVASS